MKIMTGIIICLPIFAQATDLGAGAGWAGAGLLGLVLGWLLLKHLPEKDEQIERLIKRGDERSDKLANEFKTSLEIIMNGHKLDNEELIRAMKDEFTKIVGMIVPMINPQSGSNVHPILKSNDSK